MTAWMQNWDTVGHRKNTMGWFSQMTVPRELSIQNGRLIQNPVREIEQYRHDPVEYKGVLLDHEKIVLDGIQGRIADIELVIRPIRAKIPIGSLRCILHKIIASILKLYLTEKIRP